MYVAPSGIFSKQYTATPLQKHTDKYKSKMRKVTAIKRLLAFGASTSRVLV